MLVSKSWCEETAKDIIYEFEELLADNDIRINNKNPKENKFESEEAYINIKDFEKIKEKITKQLSDFADYIEYRLEDAA